MIVRLYMCSGKEYRFLFKERERGQAVVDGLMSHRHGFVEFTLHKTSYNINRAHIVSLEMDFVED